MSGILERLEEERGSRDDRRKRLRSNTCERNIDDKEVFTSEARIKKSVKSRLGTQKREGLE